MPRRPTRTLTETELEFMKAIWNRGESSIEEVLEVFRSHGRNITGGTARKMLSILVRKGYISRRKVSPFLYQQL